MTRSVLAGMAVFGALAVGVGNGDAHVHKSHVHKPPVHLTMTAPTLPSLTAKGGPLHDCVHVTFPQCGDRGFNGPND
jgi:hypothetical protein